MTTEQIEESAADGSLAEAHRLMMDVYPAKAAAENMGAPLYFGWVIREAFLAGVKWERERVEKSEGIK